MTARTSSLADILVAQELVAAETFTELQIEHGGSQLQIGRLLVDRDVITDEQLMAAVATQLDIEFVELAGYPIDTVAASLLPDVLARRHAIIAIGFDDQGRLRLAMADPANVVAIDDARTLTGHHIQPVAATRSDILDAIAKHAGLSDAVESVIDGDDGDTGDTVTQLGAEAEDAPIVKFVNAVIQQAVASRASDIHIEPGERNLRVRFRVDGVLHEISSQHRSIHAGVVSRLKIMADLDIAERRVPQDGRISVRIAEKAIDLRVSTLPTVYGEKVAMRILDKTAILLQLSDLGFLDRNYVRYERNFRKPYGMILVTGPTGSGKSTTLYATLNVLASPDVNVVTTEDPVEYRLAGINQVQINTKAGLTFPKALRSILRQDPDIVLVGEMRDHETAQIGMEAALTGHLVLSTLHTNDAPSAVTRLTEMGIDAFLVASAVDCVLAQRLARQLCANCRESYTPTGAELQTAGIPWRSGAPLPRLYRATGCNRCGDTGYLGRLAVHEVMEVDETIERMISAGGSTDEIANAARTAGMTTLREDGLAKVLLGHTTLEEIARVVT
ncbi:MAG: Flp pilus assembly complex ATPase component TadA [Actinobacteria bacterium]|nr:Flp pilus assembly complex ATPase component TadA [Actinomycetota bacterium]